MLDILWFGSALHSAAILIAAISSLPIPTEREVGSRIGERASPLISVVAPAVIVLGFARGTFLGPIKGLDDVFDTTSGIT